MRAKKTVNISKLWKHLVLSNDICLHIEYYVSDKYWANIYQVKQKARLTLEQSGIHIYEEPLFIIEPYAINLGIFRNGLICLLNYAAICLDRFDDLHVEYDGRYT